MNRKKFFLMAWLGIFMLYAALYLSIIGKAQLDPGDDYGNIAWGKKTSWKTLAASFFSPELINLKDPVSHGLSNHASTTRVGKTIFYKFAETLFGNREHLYYGLPLFFIFLNYSLICLIVYRITSSISGSILSALSFLLAPMAFLNGIWLADFSYVIHFLTLAAFALFLEWYKNRPDFKKMFFGDAPRLFLIIFIAWSAIRSMPSGYIIPIVIGVFALSECGRSKAPWVKNILIFFTASIICAAAAFFWHTKNYPDFRGWTGLMFFNTLPTAEYEVERKIALFDWSAAIPVSALRNIGMPIAWLVIIGSGYLLFKKNKIQDYRTKFILIWFLCQALLTMLVREAVPRYLSYTLIPMFILLAIFFVRLHQALPRLFLQRALILVLGCGLVYNFVNNIQHMIFLRVWKMGDYQMLGTLTKTVYRDYHEKSLSELPPIEEIATFFIPETGPWAKGPSLAELITFSDVSGAYRQTYDPKRAQEVLERFGKDYWVTGERLLPPSGYQEVAKYSLRPKAPLLDWLYQYKKRKKDGYLWIYRRPPV